MKFTTDKKKKLLMMLPLFLIPVLIIGYGIFGDKISSSSQSEDSTASAFNRSIPSADTNIKPRNKLEAYLYAQEDSARKAEARKKDPYLSDTTVPIFNPLPDDYQPSFQTEGISRMPMEKKQRQLDQRLEQLYKSLQEKTVDTGNIPVVIPTPGQQADAERLHEMMQAVTASGNGDAELDKLETLLEKALDLQHPQRVRQRLQQQASASQPPALNVSLRPPALDSLPSSVIPYGSRNAFYTVSNAISIAGEQNDFVKAVVHDDQVILDGQSVKMRLLQNIYIGATCIPANSFIWGAAARSGDRLTVEIRSIGYQQIVYPVKMQVFDAVDGMEGLRIEGADNQDASKESMEQALSQIQLAGIDPSIGQQAAVSGIQTIQNLLSRKIRKKPVSLKSGHSVLLKIKTDQ